MSGYRYDQFIDELCVRTLKNLEIIKSNKENGGYEVTQLINSLMSLIILPREMFNMKINRIQNINEQEFLNSINYLKLKLRIKDYIDNDLCIVSRSCSRGNGMDPNEFIRHIRNSLAHNGKGRLGFLPCNNDSEIESILFIDFDDPSDNINTKDPDFVFLVSIEELSDLVTNIKDYYHDIYSNEEWSTLDQDISKDVKNMRQKYLKMYRKRRGYVQQNIEINEILGDWKRSLKK